MPFTIHLREFDAIHTLYFLIDKSVKFWVSRVLALVNHFYKIIDDSSSELTSGVEAYGNTWVEQVAFARPLSNGHRFRESKGNAQPRRFIPASSVADRILDSLELAQQNYFYGP